jgi:hypothetical protein
LSSSRAARSSAEVDATDAAGRLFAAAISPAATTTATCGRSSTGLRRASSWAR